MRVVVFGAGGVGGTIAGRLHRAGAEVVAIARGARADAMRKEGLRLVTPDGDWRLRVPVAAHPKDLDWRQDDIVVLAVKSQQSARALADLAAVAPETTVVCAQNGVANERLASFRTGRRVRVAGLVIMRQRPSTAKGITFVTIEDETGIANLVVHQKTWNQYYSVARRGSAWLAHGNVENKHSVIHVVVRRLELLGDSLKALHAPSRDFR